MLTPQIQTLVFQGTRYDNSLAIEWFKCGDMKFNPLDTKVFANLM